MIMMMYDDVQLYDYDDEKPASIFAATILPGAARGAHLHREADKDDKKNQMGSPVCNTCNAQMDDDND